MGAAESSGQFGKFRVLGKLGEGGMAEILLGRLALPGNAHKDVVIKRIRPEFAHRTEFVEMFLDEIRIAVSLQHENIIQVFEAGEEDGRPYRAMEYLQGLDARALLEKVGPIPVEHVLAIGQSVASGLAYVHDKAGEDGRRLEIVHRDISPSNIFLTRTGGIKLMDFGVAHARDRLTKTETGGIKGKIPYMSPEQCSGDRCDGRSDIFSLGVVLHELATGTRPFDRGVEAPLEIMNRVVDGAANLAEELPAPLRAVIARAVAADPGERFSNGDELYSALEQCSRQLDCRISYRSLAAFVQEHSAHTSAQDQVPWLEGSRRTELARPRGLESEHTTADEPKDKEAGVPASRAAEAGVANDRRRWIPYALLLVFLAAIISYALLGVRPVLDRWQKRSEPAPAPAGESGDATGNESP